MKLFIISLFLILQYSALSNSLDFNRNFTGVSFSVYVRCVEKQGDNPDWKTYTLEDVKIMLKVVSGKFSKILTSSVGANSDLYEHNATYYKSFSQVYVAEAAALLNLEAKHKLTVVIGVWLLNNPNKMSSEMQVALEAASKANSIYSGTVPGLVLCGKHIATEIKDATVALSQLQNWRKQATTQNLRLGTKQSCKDIFSSNAQQSASLRHLTIEILKLSDFIVCYIDSSQYQLHLGPSNRLNQVFRDFLRFQRGLKLINPEIEVTMQTGISSEASTATEINDLKEYWKSVDNWAVKSKISVWMREAFDNPWKSGKLGHKGWWRLTSNDEVGKLKGYSEKIINDSTSFNASNKNEKCVGNRKFIATSSTGNDSSGAWTYVGIFGGLFFTVAFGAYVAIFHSKFQQLQIVLSVKEVKEFKLGGGYGQLENEYRNKPYDDSYEISKDNLTILWDSVLSSGEFGMVCKALMESPDGDIEVALKVAKDGCSKHQVKSILNEIKMLIYLGYHPNLLSVKGAYTAEIQKGVVYLVTELCSLGSLHSYLKSSQENSLLEKDINCQMDDDDIRCCFQYSEYEEVCFLEMVRWSHEIACGLEYLAEKRVVHADLATRNVLLTCDKTAKITDFGLCRRPYDYKCFTTKQETTFPWRWMAIESLRKFEFSSQSDVWSYGVTLWEIFSIGHLPYPGVHWSPDYVSDLERGLRMNCPSHASQEIYTIMLACWEKDPSNRPNFTQLKSEFLQILDDLKQVPEEMLQSLEPSLQVFVY